jgi:hypothetical protein
MTIEEMVEERIASAKKAMETMAAGSFWRDCESCKGFAGFNKDGTYRCSIRGMDILKMDMYTVWYCDKESKP